MFSGFADHLGSCCPIQLFAEFLGLVLVLFYLLRWYGRRSFTLLKKINLSGPKPSAYLGNLLDINKAGGLHKYQLECGKKYGKCYTVCIGQDVSIVVADPEILKQIMVKEFSNFPNRASIGGAAVPYPMHLNVLRAKDETWKRIRTTLTPAFSTAKLKQLTELMEAAADTLQNKVKQVADTGKSVDMKEWFNQMTLEVILSAAFGVQSDVQTNQKSEMLEKSKILFRQPVTLIQFLGSLPFAKVIGKLRHFMNGGAFGFFIETAAAIIKMRREQADKGIMVRKDLIHLMLTAHEETGPEGKGSKLTNDEMVAQSVTFLLAGQETSSNTLTFVLYLLAMNPEIQDELRSEINQEMESSPDKPLYELVNNMKYLDCVINESQRLYPPAHNINRICKESCTINGVHFPAGVQVGIPIYALHHDPEAWPDVDKFDPDRFLGPNKDKIHPFQFIPFGAGPRACIGLRFALLEIKMTLVKILRNYKFVRSPETQVPLALVAGVTLTARDGVHVRVESV